jgi:hypothetical protein
VGKDSNGELCLKESFVCFAEASSTSGEYIAQKIVDKFNEFGLVIDNLRGQGYNGAGHMAGTFSISRFLSIFPANALFNIKTTSCFFPSAIAITFSDLPLQCK